MPTQEQIAEFVQKLLMVAGGFAAGYLLSWVACVGFDKTVIRGKSPDSLHKWARRIGGLLVALVVAFFVFRGGTGNGGGTGGGTGEGTGRPAGASSSPTDPAPTAPKTPEVAVDAVPVFVTVYAGPAVERDTMKFFAVGDPPGSKAERASVEDAVRAKGADKSKVVLVYSLDPTASTTTTAFFILQNAAKELGVPLVAKTEFDSLRRK